MNKSMYWFGILLYTLTQVTIGIGGAFVISLAQVTQYTLPNWAYLIFMFAIGSLWGLSHIAAIGAFANE